MIVMGWDVGAKGDASVVIGEMIDGKMQVVEVRHLEAPIPAAIVVGDGWGGKTLTLEGLHVEMKLRQRGVSPEIIARVLRLNTPEEMRGGYELRGIHYKPGRWWGLPRGLMQKGKVLRFHGRAVWDAIPRGGIRKHGRREFAPCWNVEMAVRKVSKHG